jgi:hypothetical protein
MKLQRTTLILLVTAILLGGFVYYSEIQGAQKREAAKTTKRPIFSFKEDQIQSLTIYMGEETLEFERVSGKETAWQMKTPNDVPASDASIAFLSNLLVEGKSDRSFPIKANQLQEYGLDKPTAVVKVQAEKSANSSANLRQSLTLIAVFICSGKPINSNTSVVESAVSTR